MSAGAGQPKCGTASCTESATVVVFWPGQTTVMCAPCSLAAVNIASAMSFNLAIRPLEPQSIDDEETPP